MSALLKNFVQKMILNYLKQLEGIDQKYIEMRLESGELVLQNLKFRIPQTPNNLIQLKSVSIKKLELNIPWLQLIASPISLKAYDISIEVDIVHTVRQKSEILRNKHNMIKEFIKQALERSQPSSITNTIKKKILSTVVKNLNIEVHNLSILFRAGKHFDADVNFNHIELVSVPSPKNLELIHKLLKCQVQISHFSKTSRIKEVYFRTSLTSELEFSEPSWSSSNQYLNLNVHIAQTKINLSQKLIARIQRTLKKIPQPIQQNQVNLPTKMTKDYYLKLFRYAVRKVIQQQKYQRFRKLLTYSKFDIQQLENEPIYHQLIYNQTPSKFRLWVNRALKIKETEEVSLLYFNSYTVRVDIESISLAYQINETNSIIHLRLLMCMGKIALSKDFQISEGLLKANQLELYFDKRSVISIQNQNQHSLQLLCQKLQKGYQYRFKLNHLKIKYNLNHIEKLIKSLYKFLLPSKQRYIVKENTISRSSSNTKQKDLLVLQLRQVLVSVNMFSKTKKVVSNVLFKRFELGYYRNQMDIKMLLAVGVEIQQDLLQLTQQFQVDTIIKLGHEYNVLIKKSNINLDIKIVDVFLDVLQILKGRVMQLTAFFSSKTYQIQSSMMLGMLSLNGGKGVSQYFYAFNEDTIYLYSITQQTDQCIKSVSLPEIDHFSKSKSMVLRNKQEIKFRSSKQMQVIRKSLDHQQQSAKSTSIKIEIRETNVAVEFIINKENHLLITDINELTMRYNQKLEIKANLSVSLTQQKWRLVEADNLRLSYNQKKNRKITVTADKILLDYSHQRLLRMVATYQSLLKKVSDNWISSQDHQVESEKLAQKAESTIDIAIKNFSCYFIINDKSRFLKLEAFDTSISLSHILKLQTFAKLFDMTSYPLTKFQNQQRQFAQTYFTLIDGDLNLSQLKVLFITEPLLRIIDYFLNLMDYYLPTDQSKQLEKSQTKVTIKAVQATLFPTKFKLFSQLIDIMYVKDVIPLQRSRGEKSVTKIVTIAFRGVISSKEQKILDSSDFTISYDILKRVMNIELSKLFLSFSQYSFQKVMAVVFHNLIYSDLVELNQHPQHYQPKPLEVNFNTNLVSILINNNKSVFEVLIKSFWVNYSKDQSQGSSILIDFERFKVNEIAGDKRIKLINQLPYSLRSVRTDNRKHFLKMISQPKRGPEIQINIPQLDILFTLSKVLDLCTFWNYQLNNKGLKMEPSQYPMHIGIFIPNLKLFTQTPGSEVYEWNINCLVDYTSNIVRNQTTRSSVLIVHVNEVKLFPFTIQDLRKRRQMLNNPNIKLTLEMVSDKNPQNPKSIYNLNLVFEKTRLHANLTDVLNFHELITQHFNPVQKLPTAIKNIEKNVMETDAVKEGDLNISVPGEVQTMYVFEARVDEIEMIVSSSANEQIVPLLQFIVKCEQCMGTMHEDVQLFNFKMNLFLGYFNLKATRIEPIIESMEFVVQLCRNKYVDPSTFLSIIIPLMKLNISDEMYDTLMRVYKDKNIRLLESNQWNFQNNLLKSTVLGSLKNDNARLISLFSFRNLTGFKIRIEEISEQQSKVMMLNIGEYFHYKVFENEDDFGKTFQKSVKFKVIFEVKKQELYEIKSVKINSLLKKETYIKYFPKKLGSDKITLQRFFIGTMELAESEYRKEFVLKSRLFFLNETSQSLELNFSNGKENYLYQLGKDNAIPIPFSIFTSKSMVFRLRDLKQAEFSQTVLMSKYVLTDQDMESNLPQNFDGETDRVVNVQHSKLVLNNYCVHQSFEPKSRIQTILITPMMRIFNCLPVDIRLDDLNIIIEPNCSREITQFTTPRKSRISFEGYKTKEQILLYDAEQKIDRYPSIVYLNHEVGVINQRQLKLNILRKFKNGVFLIIFSARTIVLNQTGLNLTIVLGDTSSRSNICLANEDDSLKITESKNLKSSTVIQLKNFNAMIELEYYEQTNPDQQSILYEFVLNMSVKQSQFCGELIMTRVLELSPKYIIINKSSREIELSQLDSSSSLKCSGESKELLIWKEPKKSKRIVLRVAESEQQKHSRWRWSGSFSINTIRFLYLYTLKKKVIKTKKDLELSRSGINFQAERVFFQVEMKRQGDHTCIVIDEVKKKDVEHIILNKTPFTLLVEQENSKSQMQKDYFCVKSNQSEPFSWIEPDQKKKIKIKILKDEQIIDTNMIIDLSSIKQEGDYYNLRTFNQKFKVQVLKLQNQIIEVSSLKLEENPPDPIVLPSKKKPKQIFCTFLLQELGVSIIGSPDGKKIEVFYLQMESFDITLFWAETMKVEMRIKMFNIDNNSRYESQYPVFVTSSINLDHYQELNFFELVFEREIKDEIVMKIIQLRAFLVPITIRLDQQLGRILFVFYKSRYQLSSSEYKYKNIEQITTIDYIFAPPNQRQRWDKLLFQKENPFTMWKHRETKFSSNFVEIKTLEIPTIKISLYFSHVYSLKKDNDQVFGSLYSTFGIVIPGCQNAPINVDGIYLEDITDTTSEALINEITSLYKNQLISNALAIIGSFNILGNPVGFFLRISHGVHQLFQKPRRAIRRGPAYVTLAVFSGIFGVINNGLAAVVHFIYSISKGLSNGIAYLTFDGQYLDKRREKNRFEPNNVFEGMHSSINSVVFGVQKAIQGFFFCTRRHRDSIGMETLKALSGLVAKPTVGVLDGAKAVMIGIENMLLGDVYRPSEQRRRVPRVFYDRIRFFKEYKQADAIVYESLAKHSIGNSNLELIEIYDYRLGDNYMDFVISTKSIMLIENLKILWSISPKQVFSTYVQHFPPPETKCKLHIDLVGGTHYAIEIEKKDLDSYNIYSDFKNYVENLKALD